MGVLTEGLQGPAPRPVSRFRKCLVTEQPQSLNSPVFSTRKSLPLSLSLNGCAYLPSRFLSPSFTRSLKCNRCIAHFVQALSTAGIKEQSAEAAQFLTGLNPAPVFIGFLLRFLGQSKQTASRSRDKHARNWHLFTWCRRSIQPANTVSSLDNDSRARIGQLSSFAAAGLTADFRDLQIFPSKIPMLTNSACNLGIIPRDPSKQFRA